MDSVHNDSGNNTQPEKHEGRLFGWLVILGLFIVIAVGGIGACYQCETAASHIRTPADVSDFSIVFVNGEAILYWNDPSDAFLNHIEISWNPNGEHPVRVNKGTGKYILPGLEEGVEYNFTVTAVDKWRNKSAGKTGGTGKAYKLRKPATEPDSLIMSIKGTPVAGQATLSWTNLNELEYDHIEISYDPNHEEVIRIPKGVESKTLSGLSNGVEHTFYAVAVDAQGNRKSLKELGLFIPDHPTSPESVFGRPTTGEFTLLWDDPPDPQLDHLEIAYSPDGETLMTIAKGEQSKLINGLNNGIKYEFSVYAIDKAGHRRPVTGVHLSPSELSVNDDDLSAMVKGTPVNGQIRLDWIDPEMENFDHIEIITNPFGESKSMTVPRGAAANTFNGLSDDEEYAFMVYGIDKDGNRQVIRNVKLSTPPPSLTEGDISAMVRGKPVTGQIRLDWKNPVFAGFDHVEIVTNPEDNPQTLTVDKGMQSNIFTGLSDNEEYSFLAYGLDKDGNRRVIHGVKLSTPKQPRIIAKPVLGEVTLVWNDPPDPNLLLVNLDYSPRGETPVLVTKGTGTYTFTGLSDDREYEFHVTATAAGGISYAMPAEVIVPNILTGTPVDEQLSLEWTDPKNIDVDHIEIVYAPGQEHIRLSPRGTGIQNFTGLSNGQEYSFAVYAIDSSGKRYPVTSARLRIPSVEPPPEEPDDPLILKTLYPLDWAPVSDSTFGNSSIFALSFGHTANRIPRWVAGGDDGKMAYSNDYGVTWTEIAESHFGSFAVHSIAYSNGRWIAGGKNGKIVWSTDAVTWNEVQDTHLADNAININVVVFGDGHWAVGGGHGNIMFSEDNGLSWRLATANAFGASSASDISALAFHDGRWVAGGTNGDMAWSDDHGQNWNVIKDSPFAKYALNTIIYDKGRWLAAGYAQRIAWSNDGITWQPLVRPFYIIAMDYNGYRWVAGGQEGRLAWSGDSGNNWVSDSEGRNYFGDSWVEAVSFGRIPNTKGRWLSGGQNGKLSYADEKDED